MTKKTRKSLPITLGNGESQQIECFICKGEGKLPEKEILMKLGGEDLLNLLQMSQEQFFQALQENSPALFEQVTETLQENYKEKLANVEEENRIDLEKSENIIRGLNEENIELKYKLEQEKKARQELENKQKSVPSIKGELGEKSFKEWIDQFDRFDCSEKLGDTGDYHIKLKKRQPNGDFRVNADILVDHKRDKKITPDDVNKLIRDCQYRKVRFGYLLVESREQFRTKDQSQRLEQKEDILLFKGDYSNFVDDMAFLPFFVDIEKLSESADYKVQKEKLYRLIVSKMKELEEFKNIAVEIGKQRIKIDIKVDEMRRQVQEQMEDILGDQP